jgi:hypothetical protein
MSQRTIWTSPIRRGAGVLFAVLAAILAIGVADASAVLTTLPDGSRVSYQPVPAAPPSTTARPFNEYWQTPLTNHGGPVMTSNTNYLIFWAPKGHTYPYGYTSGVAKYFKFLAHDSGGNHNVDSVAVQYGANYSSTFAAQMTVKDPYPANGCTSAAICLTAAQLQAEVKHVVETKGLPQDLGHEYFLLTPAGVESCFEPEGHSCSANAVTGAAYCAFHGYIPTGTGGIVWSNDPFVLEKNCDEPTHHPNGVSDSALLGGLSHEHNESITDPQLNAWFNSYGYENGDLCRTFNAESEFGTILGTAPDGSPYNQVIDKHLYFYQQEWSNVGNTCKQHS